MKIFNKIKRISTIYDLGKRTKMDNFNYLNTFVPRGQTVLVGDSITEIYNVTDLFVDYTRQTGLAVLNRGISGDTSDRLRERYASNVLAIEPANIVMLIGINDIGSGITALETKAYVEAMLRETKEQCPNAHVILEAVYPVNVLHKPSRRNNTLVKEWNRELRSAAEAYGATYLDLADLLSDNKGNLNEAYSYDGLHLNARGFKVVTDALVPLLLSQKNKEN